MKKIYLIAALFLFLHSKSSEAQQSGVLDTTFGHPMKENFFLKAANGSGIWERRQVLLQPDHKLLIAGGGEFNSGHVQYGVTRLNPDDTFDSLGFSTSNPILDNGFNNVNSIALQPDGKILVAGRDGTSNLRLCLARVNADRTTDTTFHRPLFSVNSEIYDTELQPDGKILLVGNFSEVDSIPYEYFVRLNQDGTIDTSFHITQSGFDDRVYTVTFDSLNNRILVGGSFVFYNFQAGSKIISFHLDGTRDTSFHSYFPGTTLSDALKITVQPDGKILIGGNSNLGFTRLNQNGSFDTTFHTGTGFGALSHVDEIVVDSLNRIIVGGHFETYNGYSQDMICRLLPDGSIDSSFYNNGSLIAIAGFATIYSIIIQPDGKLICSGEFGEFNKVLKHGIFRLLPDGYLDNSFHFNLGLLGVLPQFGEVNDIVVLANSEIFFAGFFDRYDGKQVSNLIRLHHSGELDTSFHVTFSTGNSDKIRRILVDETNQKIYAAGYFFYCNGYNRKNQVRLNWDGSLDTTFNFPFNSNSQVQVMAMQSNGKLILAGTLEDANNVSYHGIVRLHNDGSLDTSFHTGQGFSNFPAFMDLVIQTDGKIIVAGNFSSYDGQPSKNIVRINQDGTYDNSFDVNAGFDDDVYDLALSSNGNIYACGIFNTYKNHTGHVVAIAPNGNPDPGFNVNLSLALGTHVKKIFLQGDGKIILGGNFRFSPWNYSGILRLQSDGTLDSTIFQNTLALFSNVNDIEVDANTDLVIGGLFSHYEQYQVQSFLRVFMDNSTVNIKHLSKESDLLVYPNPASESLFIVLEEPFCKTEFMITDMLGKIQTSPNVVSMSDKIFRIHVSELPAGVYVLVVLTKAGKKCALFNKTD